MHYSHAGSIHFCSCTAGYGTSSSSLLALHWCVQQGKKQLFQLPRSLTSGTETTISFASALSPEQFIVLTQIPRYRDGPSPLMLHPSNIHCLTSPQNILVGQWPRTLVQQMSYPKMETPGALLLEGYPGLLQPTQPYSRFFIPCLTNWSPSSSWYKRGCFRGRRMYVCVVVPWKYVAANLANLYSERSSSSSSGRGNAASRSSSSSSFWTCSRSCCGRTCQTLSIKLSFPIGPDFSVSLISIPKGKVSWRKNVEYSSRAHAEPKLQRTCLCPGMPPEKQKKQQAWPHS